MPECARYREAISARLDGEGSLLPTSMVDAHVRLCAACRGFAGQAAALRRRSLVTSALSVPDLSASILRAHAPTRAGRAHVERLRWVVALAGLVQLLLAVPGLLGSEHVVRELASWELALGGALLVAAWRPAHARGLVPMVGVVAAASLVGAVADLAVGAAGILAELTHLVPVVSVGLLRTLARDADAVAPRRVEVA